MFFVLRYISYVISETYKKLFFYTLSVSFTPSLFVFHHSLNSTTPLKMRSHIYMFVKHNMCMCACIVLKRNLKEFFSQCFTLLCFVILATWKMNFFMNKIFQIFFFILLYIRMVKKFQLQNFLLFHCSAMRCFFLSIFFKIFFLFANHFTVGNIYCSFKISKGISYASKDIYVCFSEIYLIRIHAQIEIRSDFLEGRRKFTGNL